MEQESRSPFDDFSSDFSLIPTEWPKSEVIPWSPAASLTDTANPLGGALFILQSSPAACAVFLGAERILYFNSHFQELFRPFLDARGASAGEAGGPPPVPARERCPKLWEGVFSAAVDTVFSEAKSFWHEDIRCPKPIGYGSADRIPRMVYSPVSLPGGEVLAVLMQASVPVAPAAPVSAEKARGLSFRAMAELAIDCVSEAAAIFSCHENEAFLFLFGNSSFNSLAGMDPRLSPFDSQMIFAPGAPLEDVIPNGMGASLREKAAEAARTGRELSCERMLTVGKAEHRMACRVMPVTDESGACTHIVLVLKDITRLAEARESALTQEHILAAAAAAQPIGFWEFDFGTGLSEVSRSFLDLLGAGPEGVGSRFEDFMGLIHPDDHSKVREAVGSARGGSPGYRIEIRARRLDGELRWYLIAAATRFDAEGRAAKLAGIVLDIHERKTMEKRVAEQNQLLDILFSNGRIGVTLADPETNRFLRVNDRFCEITGYTREELLSMTFHDVSHPDDVDPTVNLTVRLRHSDEPGLQISKRYRKKDGSIVYVEVVANVVRDEEGKPKRFLAAITDVTERENAKAALEETRSRLAAIVDSAPSVLCLWRVNGPGSYTVVQTNPYGLVMAGFDAHEDIVGRDLREMVTAEEYERMAPWMDQVLRDGKGSRHEIRYETPLGRRWVSLNIAPAPDAEGRIRNLVTMGHDITEMKEAEAKIRTLTEEMSSQASLFRTLFERSPMATAMACDPECRQVLLNPSMQTLIGIPPGASIEEMMHYGRHRMRFFHQGRPVPIEEVSLMRAVLGESVRGREYDLHLDGKYHCTVLAHAEPIFDAEGRPSGAVSV